MLKKIINKIRKDNRFRTQFYIAGFLVGLALLAFLIYKINLREVYLTILTANPIYILLAFFLHLLVLFLGGANIFILIKYGLKYDSKFLKIGKYYLLNWVISLILPIRMFSLSLIAFLKKAKIEIKDGIAVSFLDKIITFVVLFSLATFGLFYFFPGDSTIFYIIIFIIILLAASILLFSKKSEQILLWLFSKFNAKKFASDKIVGFVDSSKKLIRNKKIIFINFFLTIIRLSMVAATILFLFKANVSISTMQIPAVLLIAILVSTISSLPITPAGLGIREVSAVVLFGTLMHFADSIIISTYLIFLVLRYGFAMLVLLIFLFKKVCLRKRQPI